MVFVLVMTWYGHVPRDTLSVIGLRDQASVLSGPSKQAVGGELISTRSRDSASPPVFLSRHVPQGW